jgi:hypothetical protein
MSLGQPLGGCSYASGVKPSKGLAEALDQKVDEMAYLRGHLIGGVDVPIAKLQRAFDSRLTVAAGHAECTETQSRNRDALCRYRFYKGAPSNGVFRFGNLRKALRCHHRQNVSRDDC